LSVALVIVNWNGLGDTLACLESLRASTQPVHAIVVDNDSAGDDLERLRASGLAGEVIAAESNLGFAAGSNAGLERALAGGFALVGVLNNDTVVEPESIARLAEHLPEGRERAISPDIRYFDEPERSWFAGGVLDRGWPRHLQPSELSASNDPLRDCDCLSGCCIVARREVWQRVGLFDPRYFLIFEDSDWSMRARREGVELCVATASAIRHKVSRTISRGSASLLSDFYFARNGLIFDATYCRRFLPSFLMRWLIRPSASALLRRRAQPGLGFRWLGALAFLTRRHGRAPAWLERLAARAVSGSR
jgi:GT2 family glycosyltransferase